MDLTQIRLANTVVESAPHLEWLSRKVSKRHLHGIHNSKQLGQGLEFAQYRPYIQGDDLRQLDWKLYAKTGKYFIRQSPISAQNHMQVMIDNSPSMQYREGGYSKLELSKIICGALTYIAINQGDSFSWLAGSTHWPDSGGHKKWQASIQSLHELQDEDLSDTGEIDTSKGHLIWISDLYVSSEKMRQIISLNAHPNIELTLIHLMGRREEELSFDSSINFKDLETGERIELNAASFRETYTQRLNKHYREIAELCATYNTPSVKVYIDDTIDKSLGQIVNVANAHMR